MGNLTDDMTRLRGEVDALRSDRGALIQNLARGAKELTFTVSAMQADFAADHTAMAKKTGQERAAFVAAVISEVNTLLSGFSRVRDEMARKGMHDRIIYLAELRRDVMGMCKETADDLIGARFAWRGQSPRKFRPVQLEKDSGLATQVMPPVEEAVKNTVAAPEFKEEKPPVTFMKPQAKEEKKKMDEAFEAPAVKTSKVKIQPTVFAAPETPKLKEKSRLDEKPAKTATRVKRGKK
jgi:hypothetical protein